MIKLYENIKNRRLALNMSQRELAEAVGYSHKSMISQIESGKIDLPLVQLEKIASALNITPTELLGDEYDSIEPGAGLVDAELLRMFHKLNKAQQDSIMNLIRSMAE